MKSAVNPAGPGFSHRFFSHGGSRDVSHIFDMKSQVNPSGPQRFFAKILLSWGSWDVSHNFDIGSQLNPPQQFFA